MAREGMIGWEIGFGWMGILFWAVLLLAAGALIKYLFSGSSKDD